MSATKLEFFSRSLKKWNDTGGFKEILILAFPLIVSTGAWSIQHFVDRMFLAWYSSEAIAASMPAGMTNLLFMSVFMGTASFCETFVAQYFGARRYDRIGAVIWQGIYLGAIGGLFHLGIMPLAGPIFTVVGHQQIVRTNEIVYFRLLCLGAGPAIATGAMSGFFAGLGKPGPIMVVTLFQTGVNIGLDYCMIFGRLGFPEMGIKGAALATVISGYLAFLLMTLLVMQKHNDLVYGTIKNWKFDMHLFSRILHFGLPNGIQGLVDLAGFAIFILFLGRLGIIPLAATNIAFNINTLAFMPMAGIGIAVSVLVGQNLGRNRPDIAERSAWSGFTLVFVYMAAIALLYVTVPGLFINPFAARAHPSDFEPIRRTAVILLRFVAFYSLFDGMNITFASALRGAGDTRFTMNAMLILSICVLIIPSWIFLIVLKKNLYVAWTIATVYVILLALFFLFRFLKGRWKQMRVIEPVPMGIIE
jgi:MATE family multidrug resistance protein